MYEFYKQSREIALNLGEKGGRLFDDHSELTNTGKMMSSLPLAP